MGLGGMKAVSSVNSTTKGPRVHSQPAQAPRMRCSWPDIKPWFGLMFARGKLSIVQCPEKYGAEASDGLKSPDGMKTCAR